jgi:hypothetical protein
MEEYKGYSFDVQIWEEDGKYNWAVSEEFESAEKEFIPLGFGTEDSYVEAAQAAGDVIRQHFASV